MPRLAPPETQQRHALAERWPRTLKQLESTYYTSPDWCVTQVATRNDAGYCLWALGRYEAGCANLHAHREYTLEELDYAASQEVVYHWIHGHRYQRPCCVLALCWAGLVTERPELLERARRTLQRYSHHQATE